MSDTFVSGAPVPPQGPRPQASQSQQPKRPKKPHPGLRSLLFGLLGGVIGAAAVVAVLVVGGFVAMPSSVTSGKTGSTGTTSSSQTVTVNSGDSTDTTLANAVAQKALPSVVSINVTTSDGEGVGSGVVLDTDGNILTNYHVIEGAQSISVSTGDASYDATVVGSDESSDLAVIKIDAGDAALTPIEVGDSSTLQVGDWVMSLGSPFGLEQSVSTGIVSSLYRSTMLQNTSGNTIYTNLIQTDATINPGNSGGALVDDEGKLVGINSLIESYSGSSSGVGFAIPGNYAVEVAQKLIAGQTVTHAYIGGSFQTVTANNARSNSLSVNQGAYVAELADDGPAAQAGIQKGDVITALDDEEITSSDALVLAVRSHSVGDTVTVTLMRGSKQMQVQVTLGSDEALQQQQDSDSSSQGSLLEQYLEQYGQQRGGSEDGYSRR
ncbi:S1C family serine protease [Parolsenella catena]|uniref:S1C family serine protease n=1 Tax=Parolsenella catena TaxID=2003188 RepID=UPI002E7A25A0|nr:trypsin-like peptidase domain-containing protein [Parolsenella catena]